MVTDLTKSAVKQVIMLLILSPKSLLLITLVPSCANDEFQCHTLHCIPMAAHCDGLVDCIDQSDEANCGQLLTEY